MKKRIAQKIIGKNAWDTTNHKLVPITFEDLLRWSKMKIFSPRELKAIVILIRSEKNKIKKTHGFD